MPHDQRDVNIPYICRVRRIYKRYVRVYAISILFRSSKIMAPIKKLRAATEGNGDANNSASSGTSDVVMAFVRTADNIAHAECIMQSWPIRSTPSSPGLADLFLSSPRVINGASRRCLPAAVSTFLFRALVDSDRFCIMPSPEELCVLRLTARISERRKGLPTDRTSRIWY